MTRIDRINSAVFPAKVDLKTMGDNVIICNIDLSYTCGAHLEQEVLSLYLDDESLMMIDAIIALVGNKHWKHSVIKKNKERYILFGIKNNKQKVALPLHDLRPVKAILMRKNKKELCQILDNLLLKNKL